MELSGHPTGDIVDELKGRGALMYPGDGKGPKQESLELARRRDDQSEGLWLFIPNSAFDTEIDEDPPIL